MVFHTFSEEYFHSNGTISSNCPKPCHEIQYDVAVSQAQFPNKRIIGELEDMLGFDEQYFK